MPPGIPASDGRSGSPQGVAPLSCKRCGGGFDEGAERCPWCGAGIALEDRGRSAVCTRCSRRAPLGALWCPGCGERIGRQALAPIDGGRGCPRCHAALRQRDAGGRVVTECSSCGGLWLPASVLEELCADAERTALLDPAAAVPAGPVPEPAAAYLPCPGCGELMNRRVYGGSSGVIVDVCRPHGVWLDAYELERVLAWVRNGGPDRERARRAEQARRATEVRTPTAPLPFQEEPDARLRGGVLEVLGRLVGLLG